jgi:cytochrome P450
MAGLPEDRFHEFREWVLAAVGSYDAAERQRTFDKVLAMTAPLVRERMQSPGNDLISRIIEADLDGRKPTFDEVQSFYLMLFIAGLDTVVNAMSVGMRHLAIDAELQDQLRANPWLQRRANEELLRRYSIALPGRQVTRAADFRGAPLRHGDSVMLFLPGANIDAAFYADPTQIVLNRPESHIAFGMGPHRCVGQHLARIELNILYEEWLARIPPFRLNSDKPWQFHPALVLSIDALPLVWR